MKTPDISEQMYSLLRQLASEHLAAERAGHTLQPTALANEAYLRLVQSSFSIDQPRPFVIAAMITVLREVLVDHARRRNAEKRGGKRGRESSEIIERLSTPSAELSYADVVAVNDALLKLGERSPRQARLVELRFFGGLTLDDAADVLEQSRRTTINDWNVAKAFLRVVLTDADSGELV
jgi:RNA polymerase sigma-70 factor (ECF subfamily)